MENRDFRDRLRNHQTNQNPEAWKQMAEMLDALPVPVEEKKDRKWWLLFLFALLLGMAMILINREFGVKYISENLDNRQITIDKPILSNVAPIIEPEQETLDLESGVIVQSENKPSAPQNLNQSTSTVNEVSSTMEANNAAQKNRVQRAKAISSSRSAVDLNKGNSGIENNKERALIFSNGLNESKPQIINSTLSKRILSQNEMSDVVNIASMKGKSGFLSAGSDEGTEGDAIQVEESITAFPSLRLLEYNKLTAFDQRLAYVLGKPNNEIILPKIKKHYWFGSAGVSDINGSRGYYLGGGLLLDLDKVASFEVDLGLWGANERSQAEIQKIKLGSSDIEVGITIWLQLNLLRNIKHKLSLELGPSCQYAWGAERIWYNGGGSTTLGEISYVGLNFRGGASYTYFINEQSGIGIKGAFALYHSGYVALKYYKRI